MTRSTKGALCVLTSTILYSLGGVLIMSIPPEWNGLTMNAARSLISVVVYTAFLLFSRHKLPFNRWVLFGAVNVGLNNTVFAVANRMTSVANVTVLQFTAPVFIIIFSALFLRKRPRRLEIIACGVVFSGICCFFLDSLGGGTMAGDLLAVFSGMLYGLTFMLNDMPDGDPVSSVFFGAFLGAILGVPSFLADPPPALEGMELVSMLVLGLAQTGLAYVFLILGLRSTPAITASLIAGIEPILGPTLVAIVYKEVMGRFSILGACVVVGGVVVYNVLKAREETSASS